MSEMSVFQLQTKGTPFETHEIRVWRRTAVRMSVVLQKVQAQKHAQVAQFVQAQERV